MLIYRLPTSVLLEEAWNKMRTAVVTDFLTDDYVFPVSPETRTRTSIDPHEWFINFVRHSGPEGESGYGGLAVSALLMRLESADPPTLASSVQNTHCKHIAARFRHLAAIHPGGCMRCTRSGEDHGEHGSTEVPGRGNAEYMVFISRSGLNYPNRRLIHLLI